MFFHKTYFCTFFKFSASTRIYEVHLQLTLKRQLCNFPAFVVSVADLFTGQALLFGGGIVLVQDK